MKSIFNFFSGKHKGDPRARGGGEVKWNSSLLKLTRKICSESVEWPKKFLMMKDILPHLQHRCFRYLTIKELTDSRKLLLDLWWYILDNVEATVRTEERLLMLDCMLSIMRRYEFSLIRGVGLLQGDAADESGLLVAVRFRELICLSISACSSRLSQTMADVPLWQGFSAEVLATAFVCLPMLRNELVDFATERASVIGGEAMLQEFGSEAATVGTSPGNAGGLVRFDAMVSLYRRFGPEESLNSTTESGDVSVVMSHDRKSEGKDEPTGVVSRARPSCHSVWVYNAPVSSSAVESAPDKQVPDSVRNAAMRAGKHRAVLRTLANTWAALEVVDFQEFGSVSSARFEQKNPSIFGWEGVWARVTAEAQLDLVEPKGVSELLLKLRQHPNHPLFSLFTAAVVRWLAELADAGVDAREFCRGGTSPHGKLDGSPGRHRLSSAATGAGAGGVGLDRPRRMWSAKKAASENLRARTASAAEAADAPLPRSARAASESGGVASAVSADDGNVEAGSEDDAKRRRERAVVGWTRVPGFCSLLISLTLSFNDMCDPDSNTDGEHILQAGCELLYACPGVVNPLLQACFQHAHIFAPHLVLNAINRLELLLTAAGVVGAPHVSAFAAAVSAAGADDASVGCVSVIGWQSSGDLLRERDSFVDRVSRSTLQGHGAGVRLSSGERGLLNIASSESSGSGGEALELSLGSRPSSLRLSRSSSSRAGGGRGGHREESARLERAEREMLVLAELQHGFLHAWFDIEFFASAVRMMLLSDSFNVVLCGLDLAYTVSRFFTVAQRRCVIGTTLLHPAIFPRLLAHWCFVVREFFSYLLAYKVLVFNRRLVGVRSDFLMLRPSKPSSPPVTVPAPVPGKKLQSGTSGGGSDSDARPGSSSSPRDDSAAALAAFLSKDLGEGPDASNRVDAIHEDELLWERAQEERSRLLVAGVRPSQVASSSSGTGHAEPAAPSFRLLHFDLSREVFKLSHVEHAALDLELASKLDVQLRIFARRTVGPVQPQRVDCVVPELTPIPMGAGVRVYAALGILAYGRAVQDYYGSISRLGDPDVLIVPAPDLHADISVSNMNEDKE